MKSTLFLIFLFLVHFFSGINVHGIITHPLIFELEKEGRKSHILGTFHSISFEKFDKPVQEFLKSAAFLVTENKDRQLTPEFLERMGALRSESEENWFVKLQTEAQEELAKRVIPFLQKRNININLERLKLWAVVSAYQNAEFINGMDYFLMDYYGQRVEGLESMEELQPFLKIDINIEELNSALLLSDSTREEILLAKKAALEDYLQGKFVEEDSDEEVLERNKIWAPRIEALHKEGVLFAVGCAHLPNLFEILVSKGFTVKKVDFDCQESIQEAISK